MTPRPATFASYRLDIRYGGTTHPAMDIRTLFGLRVLDTVATLKATYPNLGIDFVVHNEVGLAFVLRASRDGPVVLGRLPTRRNPHPSRGFVGGAEGI